MSTGIELVSIRQQTTYEKQINKKHARKMRIKLIKKHWQYYLVFLLPLVFIVVFRYIPMGGVLIAFKRYDVRLGILGSPWAGLRYFRQFFSSPRFWELLKNTLGISLYSLAAGFPIPIILALALNETTNLRFKKTVQMVTYAPHFISTVVMVGMLMQFLDLRIGPINVIIRSLGGLEINFMGRASLFKTIFVFSGIWQHMGYAAIIYIAALTSIDPNLYEASYIDGASRFQRMLHIDIPGIMPTIVILLILNIGRFMSVGFEKIYLMQNPLNISTSEVFATYVYKIGLLGAQYSFATAVGLFNSIVNLILLVLVNKIAKSVAKTSLW